MVKVKNARDSERMSNFVFIAMNFIFKIMDFLYPKLDQRIKTFCINKNMIIADYGCGPGRYAIRFAKLVGDQGKIYAIDNHQMAIEIINKKKRKLNIHNIESILVHGFDTKIPEHTVDVTCAIDMFFMIKHPTTFLGELKRITKKDGHLIIDDGHQSRAETKRKILASGNWEIIQETRDHLVCKPA